MRERVICWQVKLILVVKIAEIYSKSRQISYLSRNMKNKKKHSYYYLFTTSEGPRPPLFDIFELYWVNMKLTSIYRRVYSPSWSWKWPKYTQKVAKSAIYLEIWNTKNTHITTFYHSRGSYTIFFLIYSNYTK